MTQMTKGANIALSAQLVRAVLFWSGGAGVPDVDGSALLLRADGKVASDDDMVFYNQPQHPSGAVQAGGVIDCDSRQLGLLRRDRHQPDIGARGRRPDRAVGISRRWDVR